MKKEELQWDHEKTWKFSQKIYLANYRSQNFGNELAQIGISLRDRSVGMWNHISWCGRSCLIHWSSRCNFQSTNIIIMLYPMCGSSISRTTFHFRWFEYSISCVYIAWHAYKLFSQWQLYTHFVLYTIGSKLSAIFLTAWMIHLQRVHFAVCLE